MISFLARKGRGAYARFRNCFRPRRREIRQVTYRGAELLILANEDIGWMLLRDGRFEEAQIAELERHIRPDDTCVDVGANVGIYTVFMARKASRGRVIAFEPQPLVRRIAELALAMNGLTNVEMHGLILDERAGTREFSLSTDSAFSSLRPSGRKAEVQTVSLEAQTLDGLFAGANRPVDVIKVDVEGAELPVLRGARALLSSPELRPRAALVECSRGNQATYGYGPGDVVEFMAALGYQVHCFVDGHVREGCGEAHAEELLFLHRSPRSAEERAPGGA